MAPTQRAIIIDRSLIVDKVSFHQVFAAAFGFPEFYGRKVAAWIDCMSSLDEAFCAVQVEPGQVVSAGSGVLFRMARGGEFELLARLAATPAVEAGRWTREELYEGEP